MREIKFRVWDPLAEEMIGWKHWNKANAFYFINSNGSSIFTMQYTGLKDKNGKEIYEGDIVKGKRYGYDKEWHRHIGKVEWFSNKYLVMGAGKSFGFTDELVGGYEVIGNTYEHPHLLEPKDSDSAEMLSGAEADHDPT